MRTLIAFLLLCASCLAATPDIQFQAPSGLVLDLRLCPLAADTLTETIDAIEFSNAKGWYQAACGDGRTGTFRVTIVLDGTATVIGSFVCTVANDENVYRPELIPDSVTAQAIAAGAIVKGTEATGWNDLSASEVNDQADAAIETYHLDHLLAAAVGADFTGQCVDNSILARVIANGDTSTFTQATDSLSELYDTLALILTDTGTTLDAKINTIENDVAAIRVDTETTLDAKITTIDGIVDAILSDTDELQSDNIPGLIAALNDFDPATEQVTLANGPHGGAAATITLSDYSDFQGAAGDPWAVSLPGAYGAGTAGYILGTNLDAVLTARTLATAAYFDPAADAVANVTTVATLTGHTPQTADHAASIASILADTNELQTDDVPGLIAALNDFDPATETVTLANGPHGGAAATITLSDYSDFQGGGASVEDIADAVWDESLAGHNTAQSAGWYILRMQSWVFTDGTAVAISASTIQLEAGASAVDEFYRNCHIIIGEGEDAQSRMIAAYDGDTRTVTFARDLVVVPDPLPAYTIVAGELNKLASNGLDNVTDDIDAIVDAALATIGLDHLISAAVDDGDVADDSIISVLTSKAPTADFSTHDNRTDSLEAISDRTR